MKLVNIIRWRERGRTTPWHMIGDSGRTLCGLPVPIAELGKLSLGEFQTDPTCCKACGEASRTTEE